MSLQTVNAAALQAAKISKNLDGNIAVLQGVTTGLDVPAIDASLTDLNGDMGVLQTVTTGLDVPAIDSSLTDLDARVAALENP